MRWFSILSTWKQNLLDFDILSFFQAKYFEYSIISFLINNGIMKVLVSESFVQSHFIKLLWLIISFLN